MWHCQELLESQVLALSGSWESRICEVPFIQLPPTPGCAEGEAQKVFCTRLMSVIETHSLWI